MGERAARRYRDQALAGSGVLEPPRASLADGAAGVAYFLLRHASLGGEASLGAACWWAAEAERAAGREGAFGAPAAPLGFPAQTSMYCGEPGVWWVRALVAAAAGDRDQARRSAARFAALAELAAGEPGDVFMGSAGLLLGCAQLAESLGDPVAVARVRAAGERLAFDLAALAEREGALPAETALDGYLGAAHGWAGVAHALLRWGRAAGAPPAGEALALLERLIVLRRPSGRWPSRSGSREVWRGWCRGSAGWAQLWTLAWQLTGEEWLLRLAAHSAQDAVDADVGNASLCCGRTGQAYAALTLYRATAERRWLTAAHRVAKDAAHALEEDGTPPHRLFSGELGVALLTTELEDPARTAMPVYEALS